MPQNNISADLRGQHMPVFQNAEMCTKLAKQAETRETPKTNTVHITQRSDELHLTVVVVVVVVVLYSPNTNRYITDTCKTNNSITGKHSWEVAIEALVLSQLATYS